MNACGTTTSEEVCTGRDCSDASSIGDTTGERDVLGNDAHADTGAGETSDDVPDTDDDADVEPEDTDVIDVVDASDGSADTAPDVVVVPDATPAAFEVAIVAPRPRSSSTFGDEVEFEGVFTSDTLGIGAASVQWYSDIDGFLSDAPFGADGSSRFSTTTLSPGAHRVTLEAFAGGETVTDDVAIGVCSWPDAFAFDVDLDDDWEVLFNASRDPRGWLEMTGNLQGRKGAIVNTARPIAAGDVRIRFDVSTGQCNDPGPCGISGLGADGFAVSIFGTGNAEETVALLERAETGGGLGYAVGGEWGDDDVDAFHIELDTWFNRYNGTNEFHTDPTEETHVAITLNGDPGNHVVWAPLPTLEDNQWHAIEIVVSGSRIQVLVDEIEVADQVVDGLSFKGGFLAFTGTTGYYTNYHRFDNLSILENCTF